MLPPLNGERLVIPVLFGAMNIDVSVDTRFRHGWAIRTRDLEILVIAFGATIADRGGRGGVSFSGWDRGREGVEVRMVRNGGTKRDEDAH